MKKQFELIHNSNFDTYFMSHVQGLTPISHWETLKENGIDAQHFSILKGYYNAAHF